MARHSSSCPEAFYYYYYDSFMGTASTGSLKRKSNDEMDIDPGPGPLSLGHLPMVTSSVDSATFNGKGE